MVSHSFGYVPGGFGHPLHYTQENQENELRDFGSPVLDPKEYRKWSRNDQYAGKDIDRRGTEAERVEIYTTPCLFGTPGFGGRRTLNDADEEGRSIIADDERSRRMDYNTSPSNKEIVCPLEQSAIDDAE